MAIDPASMDIHFSNIQGNIFGGFNKDHQDFLFLQFSDAAEGRSWLQTIVSEVATSEQVLLFKKLFKLVGDNGHVKSTWTNVAFSFSGLQALEVAQADLDLFPTEYRAGMAAAKDRIGDVGPSDPTTWIAPLGSTDIHAAVLVAADTAEDLEAQIATIGAQIAAFPTITIVFEQRGRARQDQSGHEHFGFKDGVSQPGIRGVDEPDDPGGNPDQGHPGQDLLWPGEFVLGYPTQKADTPLAGGLNIEPGPLSTSGPAWTADGSYMVFRRLRQDVAGFRAFVGGQAADLGMSPDLFGAKLVGRWASGAPLEPLKGDPVGKPDDQIDPGPANPALLDDALNNKFEYGDDADGQRVPRAAHIRKAYPRDEPTPGHKDSGESSTQTHRLLRRGIAYGVSFDFGAPDDDRGLLFVDYQRSLKDQFEFVQRAWVNNPPFPEGLTGANPVAFPEGDGDDPIIAQKNPARSFVCPVGPGASKQLKDIPQWVTTTGGEYFFQPSIAALKQIAGA